MKKKKFELPKDIIPKMIIAFLSVFGTFVIFVLIVSAPHKEKESRTQTYNKTFEVASISTSKVADGSVERENTVINYLDGNKMNSITLSTKTVTTVNSLGGVKNVKTTQSLISASQEELKPTIDDYVAFATYRDFKSDKNILNIKIDESKGNRDYTLFLGEKDEHKSK